MEMVELYREGIIDGSCIALVAMGVSILVPALCDGIACLVKKVWTAIEKRKTS